MLETIREFAGEQLRADDGHHEILRRHAEYFANLAERWGPEIRSPTSTEAMAALANDHDNVRSALEWSSGAGRVDLGLRIGAAIWTFWVERGHLAEGLAVIERLLALPVASALEPLRVDGLRALAALWYWHTDYVESARRYREAMDLAERLGDPRRFVRSEMDLVYALLAQDRAEDAQPLIEDARERSAELADPAYTAEALGLLGMSLTQRRLYEGALAAHEEALAVIESLDRPALTWIGEARGRVGNVLRLMGRLDEAADHLLAGLAMGELPAGNLASVVLAQQMAGLAWARGDHERAVRLLGFAEASAERIGGAPPLAIIEVEDPATVREEARRILGEASVDRLWAEGRALPLQEGLAYIRGGRR
jgi:tetratricopeptide (TPR) repeat protein